MAKKPTNEQTSARIARIASKGLKTPSKLTTAEIRAIAGAALTQAPNNPAKKSKS
jgi:hypothetical protein